MYIVQSCISSCPVNIINNNTLITVMMHVIYQSNSISFTHYNLHRHKDNKTKTKTPSKTNTQNVPQENSIYMRIAQYANCLISLKVPAQA